MYVLLFEVALSQMPVTVIVCSIYQFDLLNSNLSYEIDPTDVLSFDITTLTFSLVLSFTVKLSLAEAEDVIALFFERTNPTDVVERESSVDCSSVPPDPHPIKAKQNIIKNKELSASSFFLRTPILISKD